MRLAVTAAGPDLLSPIDQRFGRALYLLIVDLPERSTLVINNRASMDAAQGAGIQTAQRVIDNQATALITGNCGPKAFKALEAAGVEVYLASDETVAETLDRFESGTLRRLSAPNAESHW